MGVHLLGAAWVGGGQVWVGWPARGIVGFDGPGPDGVPWSGVARLTRVVGQHRRQHLGEPGPAPRAARLHGADGAVEHRGRLGDRVALHVDQHQRGSLLGGQLVQRVEHQPAALVADRQVRRVLGRRRGRRERAAVAVLLEVVGQRLGPAYLRGAQPVQAGVDHDPVQPGGDGGVAAEGPGPAVRRDQAVLEPVGGVLAVAHGAHARPPRAGRGAGGTGCRTPRCRRRRARAAARGRWARRGRGRSSADRHLGDLAAEAVRRPSGARSARR